MRVNRLIERQLKSHFKRYKQVLILLGARQVGKTTLLKRLFPDFSYFLFDEKPIREIFESYSFGVYRRFLKDQKKIFLDEVHLLSDPGRAIKILYDQLPKAKIVITGSSSLQIRAKTGEGLVGRGFYYFLYPLTFEEYLYQAGVEEKISSRIIEKILTQDSSETLKKYDLRYFLQEVLEFGLYPEMVSNPRDKRYLRNLMETFVFKDIFELELLENRQAAKQLLRLLAYQIGSLVKYEELAQRLGMSSKTVRRYIDIFEDTFIIFRVYPFFRNKRREIGKAPKVYFWDVGLRNALINNFDPLEIRSDVGALFENFVIAEVKKLISYLDLDYELNYWRLKGGTEVDMVLSSSKQIIGCEIKFRSGKVSRAFLNYYPKAKTHLITASNLI